MSDLASIVAKTASDMKPVSNVLYRGTEAGNPSARLRRSPDGEMGPGTYATSHKWLASSYGGGPKASVSKGTRVVHDLPVGDLEPHHVGYVYQGLHDTNDIAHLSDHRGDLLHWYDALGNTPEAKKSRQELVEVAKKHGMKILVGHDNSIATNQLNILDPSIIRAAKAHGGHIKHPRAHKFHVGPIHSSVAGRTDHLPMTVESGSYVIPADIISAWGEGNTIAGFKHARRVFSGTPYGQGAAPYGREGGPYGETRHPYGGSNLPYGMKHGGESPGVQIVAAGGEYVLSPAQVRLIGDGDIDVGHRVLDRFVKESRAQLIKTLKKLPGPKKD